MSGLAGVWNLDGKPADRADVAALASTMAHRGPDGCGIWSAGAVGLACQLLRVTPESATERQPAMDSRATVLIFDGRLDNRTELLELIAPAEVSADDPDSTIVLAAWRTWGDRFLSRLHGDFALALFDPRTQTLILARDAVGGRPLYYWTNGRRFVFASEVKAILAHPDVPRTPNEDLLADFALLERLPYDDEAATFFQGIHAVRPGHGIRVTPERISSELFWDFDPRIQVRYATYGDYAARLRELLIQPPGQPEGFKPDEDNEKADAVRKGFLARLPKETNGTYESQLVDVLRNQVVLGSVNAGREDFESAIRDLGAFRKRWPEAVHALISGRYPLSEAQSLLTGRRDGIKNVLSMSAGAVA
jgi:hypothetical protein